MNTFLGWLILLTSGLAALPAADFYIDIERTTLIGSFVEAQLLVCRDVSAFDCWFAPDSQLLLRAQLIPEKAKRGTKQQDIRRPDRFWLVEVAPDVARSKILKGMDDLGCGDGDEHFVHAIERQFVGSKPFGQIPVEFRRLGRK